MVCLVGAIEPAEKHQGGALLRAVDGVDHVGEQRRQEGHCDVVTQCGFARHIVALRASEPSARRIGSQKNSRVEHLLI